MRRRLASLCPLPILLTVYSVILPPTSTSSGRRLTAVSVQSREADGFDFRNQLLGPVSTLAAAVSTVNRTSGDVEINGVDARQPTTPFDFEWGDGSRTTGFFPQRHTYADPTRNYIVEITVFYGSGATDRIAVVVRFVAPQLSTVALPSETAVRIPSSPPVPVPRLPGFGLADSIGFYDDSFFAIYPRQTVEYLLSAGAAIQMDFVNRDALPVRGRFEQVLLRDTSLSGGGYSLWFTDPVSWATGSAELQGTPSWSVFFHEMGHNFTLNTPSGFIYGGKTDGSANAIYSETMAQIFQHATIYELVNRKAEFGLSDDVAAELAQSGVSSIGGVRRQYEDYVASGMPFTSWNDPAQMGDETVRTFMTLAYRFLFHAETDGLGYRVPVKRMMTLLQLFDEGLRLRYDAGRNTPEAETFRSTLMVAAISFAFGRDLRAEFRDLRFPVNDATYDELYSRALAVSACVPGPTTLCLSGGRFRVEATWVRPDGTSGSGHGVSLTADTGYFWFFEPTNVEAIVKVLNACALNQNIWVFAGGLTNVRVSIVVTDTRTGAVKVFENPQGAPFQPIQDTSAFGTCP